MTLITARATSAVITLDRDSALPLYRQVESCLSSAILAGVLRPGTRLPSTRALAESLGVGRNTVVLAFDELLAQGFLDARVGSGTFVAETYPAGPKAPSALRGSTLRGASRPGPVVSRRGGRIGGLGLIRVRQFAPARAFRAGVPALDAFALEPWRQEASKTQRWSSADMLGYGDPGGYRPLRQAIADLLGATRAVRCTAAQVVIVSGSQQGLDLCARLLMDPDDRVLMEDPARSGARGAFAAADLDMISVPLDAHGLRIEVGAARQPDACAVYVSPSHQYPLGVTMSMERRREVAEWARTANAWIIEDDFDSEFRFDGQVLPSIQGMAAERVVYVGSFSRALFPSLRLGYVVVPDSLVETFQRARALMDRQSPMWEQATLANFMTEGHLDRHLRRMRGIYLARRDAFFDHCDRYLRGVLDLRRDPAGLHATGLLPPAYDAREAEDAAAAHGIDVLAVSRLVREVELPPMLLLGFGVVPEAAMEPAVARLGRALAGLDARGRRASATA
jgi:GntR family transcriptional regulator / MocR family aminotransferase